jgi:hypothetical protein
MILNYKSETMWVEMDMANLRLFGISSVETEETHRESIRLSSLQMGDSNHNFPNASRLDICSLNSLLETV